MVRIPEIRSDDTKHVISLFRRIVKGQLQSPYDSSLRVVNDSAAVSRTCHPVRRRGQDIAAHIHIFLYKSLPALSEHLLVLAELVAAAVQLGHELHDQRCVQAVNLIYALQGSSADTEPLGKYARVIALLTDRIHVAVHLIEILLNERCVTGLLINLPRNNNHCVAVSCSFHPADSCIGVRSLNSLVTVRKNIHIIIVEGVRIKVVETCHREDFRICGIGCPRISVRTVHRDRERR